MFCVVHINSYLNTFISLIEKKSLRQTHRKFAANLPQTYLFAKTLVKSLQDFAASGKLLVNFQRLCGKFAGTFDYSPQVHRKLGFHQGLPEVDQKLWLLIIGLHKIARNLFCVKWLPKVCQKLVLFMNPKILVKKSWKKNAQVNVYYIYKL